MPPKAKPVDETRQLKIKTGTLKRNIKDLLYSQKEVAKEQDRLRTFVEERDENKIHQQKKVVQESESAVPRSKERIVSSLKDLEEFMQQNNVSLSATEAADGNPSKRPSGNKYDDFSDEDEGGGHGVGENQGGIDNDGEDAVAARATRQEARELLASLE